MLDIRPSCECCDVDLPPDSPLARICSFECTFCATCAERQLHGSVRIAAASCCRDRAGRRQARSESRLDGACLQVCGLQRGIRRCRLAGSPASGIRRAARLGRRGVADRTARASADGCGSLRCLGRLPGSGRSLQPPTATGKTSSPPWVPATTCCSGWPKRDGQVVGSVQLALCPKENGRHRAEVQKLFVHSDGTWQGHSRHCSCRPSRRKRAAGGRSLLVLDTLLGSHAENVYRHLGWSRAGEIPDFATSPDGELFPTVYYFKQLDA